LFLACLLAGSLAAQGSDVATRTLSTEKLAFKLPAGWQWQSEIAANIAIKKDIAVKDRTFTITAEMVFAAEGFLEDTLTGIQNKVAGSKGDFTDLKIKRGEKFAGNPAVLVSYTRVRGDNPNDHEEERQWLLRRNNALYTWTERAARAVQSQAGTAFAAARSAVTFTEKDLSRLPKTFQEEGIRYNIPNDWEYDPVKKGDDPKFRYPIMRVETNVAIKGDTVRVYASLFADKDERTLSDYEKQARDIVTKNWDEVQNFELNEKETFQGEKAFSTTFVGRPVPDQPAPRQPQLRRRDFFMKRKGHLIHWIEITPPEGSAAVDAALKKARGGISWL
jgi:hypothetical protein